ncbi:FAD-dependent oxidoreductase [Streptomyces sp. NPDC087425]|uniref:FAD-dependent oxidoreductase n=1 Tax=Streptomyces sp. NPDC087425 TaxID=3365787 RepID=UPI003824E066
MPDPVAGRRPTVVVIGASASGLFAATALAGFADVTLLERDRLPDGPTARRGVPQSRHAHLVWSGGVRAFDALVPGVIEDAVARGGRLVHIMGELVSRAPNAVWLRRFTASDHHILVCSRDLLDHVLRTRVLADPRITLRQETAAVGLSGTAAQVTGVRLRTGDTETSLDADLVVDASGRGSRMPRWLTDLGLPRVPEREVDAGIAYATRLFHAPGRTAGLRFPVVNVQATPARPPGRGGIILPVEGDRWIVTLSGTRGGEPTSDPDAFLDFALGLGDPLIGELLRNAEPIGDVVTTRSTANSRRYYEKMKSWPDGVVVLGDAVAGYNPVYGHGLTVAAQGALAVRTVLDTAPLTAPGIARRLQRAAAGPVGAAWDLAVGQDVFYPGAASTPPTALEKYLARFLDLAFSASARNPRALAAMLDVMSLEKPATRLLSPDMLIPMLFGPRKPYLDEAPLTRAERDSVTS